MKYQLVRYNLDKCYRYQEYKKAIAYARENVNAQGMREQIEKLENENRRYKQSIEDIVKPVRESENSKYLEWQSWNKAKNLCLNILIGFISSTIVCWVLGMIIGPGFTVLGMLGVILSLITLLALAVTKAGESICAIAYSKYMGKIITKIDERNTEFEYDARQYYKVIDNLYLQSLEPMHRELVLMRRAQEKQNKELKRLEKEHSKEMRRLEMEHSKEIARLEKERHSTESEWLQEQRRVRETQERLLAIEEDREMRRRHR